jgi:hypothetical protein
LVDIRSQELHPGTSMFHQRHAIEVVLVLVVSILASSCAPVDAPPTSSSDLDGAGKTVTANKPTALDDPKPTGLQQRIELAIDQVRKRDLLTTHGFWTIFHGILGLGPSLTLKIPDNGWKVNAVEFICSGAPVRGMEFIPTKDGLDVRSGETFVSQGHQDQFIAELAQWGFPANREFVVYGKKYTYMDFVRHTKARASLKSRQELSWAILVLGQYPVDGKDLLLGETSWTNNQGEKLRIEDLLRYELDQPMDNAACGGTHRLFDLAWVYYLHLRRGGQTDGVWKDIVEKTRYHHQLARKYQNPDGSFSTSFFRGPGNSPERQLRMNTTGHTLEWLALTLPDDELKQQWVQDAVNALTLMFFEIQSDPMESGSLYHATHGLLIYYARAYDPHKLGANEPYFPLPPGWKKAGNPPQQAMPEHLPAPRS